MKLGLPRHRLVALCLRSLLSLPLVVAGCTSDTTEASSTTQTSQDVGAETGPTASERSDESGIEGGSFRVGLVANITTDNWWAALDTHSQSQNQAYLTNMKPALFRLTNPGFVFVPAMAATEEPVEAVQDGDIWVVEQPIRQDRTWSDGAPITANDFVLYFDTVREFGLDSDHVESFPPSLVNISAPDDYTVRLEFDSEPGLAEWRSGVGLAKWVPAHYWQEHVDAARAAAQEAMSAITDQDAVQAIVDASLTDDKPDNDLTPEDVTQGDIAEYMANVGAKEAMTVLYAVSPVGEPSSESLIFDRWEQGVFAVTRGNADYFERGTENTLYEDGSFRITNGDRGENQVYGGTGTGGEVVSYVEGPFVSEIHWIEHGTRQEAYERLAASELDYVYDPAGLTPEVRDQLADNGDLRFSISQAEGFRYLAFNLRKAPMSDLAFRQAVGAVINKELVAETVLAGAVFPGYTIVHPDLTVWYNPDVDRPGWFDGAPGTDGQRFEFAIKTLKDAGYTWDVEPVIDPENQDAVTTAGEGLTMPNGEKVPVLEILAPSEEDDPYRAVFTVWIERWMNELGIPALVVASSFTSIIDVVFPPQTVETSQQWDMYVLGWGQIAPGLPGVSQVAFFHSREDAVIGGGFNTPGFNNPDFDSAADAFEAATTLRDAQKWTFEMERILQDELPYVVLFRPAIIEAFGSNVHFPTDAIMGGHHGFPNAWPNVVQVVE